MYTSGERKEESSNTVIPEVDSTRIVETTLEPIPVADLPVPLTVLNDITNVLTHKKVKAVIFHYPKKNSKRGLPFGFLLHRYSVLLTVESLSLLCLLFIS